MEPAKVIDGEVDKPKKNGRKLAVVEPAKVPVVSGDPWLATIERLAPAVGIDGIRELMALRREERALEAAREFNAAMAAAKSEFEPIVKRRLVEYGEGNKKTSYKHEDLGDIDDIVNPPLTKNGLFYRYRSTSNPNEPISVTCIIAHKLGHSEEVTLRAGADNSGGKNTIQQLGSTLTYLQRYTLRLALGLATARDDDGKAAGAPPKTTLTEAQAEELSRLVGRTEAPTEIGKIILQQCKAEKFTDIAADRFDKIKVWLKDKFGVE